MVEKEFENDEELDELDENEEVEENEEETEDDSEFTEEDEKALADIEEGIVPEMRDVKITETVKSSFLEYAMSVIVSRAIPDVRDGLKPVHRRIIYGMNELGIGPTKPFKKSARIVGDVMGKYHPHGDSAIYGSLVRLAQPFNTRYVLVDGHGNFGSIDGDEPAAMRYTEARMSKIAVEMVRDIDQDTVDFMDNYDGQEQEPTVLPSRFPNLIVNGSNGIAVGMATNMAPHNLKETINAIHAVAENPDISAVDLMNNYIYGPDFPTGGIILGKSGIRKAYETGQGSVVVRSRAEIIEQENGKKRIVITEIPYQVNKALMIENIAHLVRDKIVEGITDIRDESNKEGIRIVIELRRDAIAEVVLNKLYKLTQLQCSFGVINLCLVNGEPRILPMPDLIKYYLDFQVEVIGRRTRTLLRKAEARDHILNGLIIAIDNIDDVVDIIKSAKSTDDAKVKLIEAYNISEIQAKEILDMRLSKLTGLEKAKIEDEIARLNAQIAEYKEILSDRKNELKVVLDELEEIKNRFGDERRTHISNEISNIDDEDLIPEEEIIITLTKNGYIKRLSTDTFRTQNRGGRGVKGMQTHEDDVVDILVHAKTHTDLMFFTSYGKVYRMRGYQVPEFSRSAKGLPVVNLLSLEKDEIVKSIITVDEYRESDYLFFATEQGVVKRTPVKEFELIRQNGKIAISLREGDHLLDVKLTNGNATIGIASSLGKMVNFNENDVRPMGRTASGVRGMNIDGGTAVGVVTSLEGEYILAITDRGYGKMTHYTDYRMTSRGTKGVITIHATEKVGNLVTIRAVNGNEDLMVITKAGIIIRIPLEQVKIAGRNTQGVKIIRLDDDQRVSSVAVVEHQEQEEIVEEENNK